MKNWIRRWLGLELTDRRLNKYLYELQKLDRRVGRLHNKPLRHDQIQRAKKLARRSPALFRYCDEYIEIIDGAKPEETISPK